MRAERRPVTGAWVLGLITGAVLGSPAIALSQTCEGPLFPGPQFPVGDEPRAVATGDFNGDAFEDAAVANIASDDVSDLVGMGDGKFEPGQVIDVDDGLLHLAAADLDGEGSWILRW